MLYMVPVKANNPNILYIQLNTCSYNTIEKQKKEKPQKPTGCCV